MTDFKSLVDVSDVDNRNINTVEAHGFIDTVNGKMETDAGKRTDDEVRILAWVKWNQKL